MALYPQTQPQQYPGLQGFLGRAPGVENQARNALGEAGKEGIFSPYGSPRRRAMMLKRLQARQEALRRRAGTGAQLHGLDPMAARAASVNASIQGSQGTADALNEGEYGFASEQDDFLKRLFTNRLDAATQERIAKEQARAQQSGGFGQLLGSVAGSVIPGLLPWQRPRQAGYQSTYPGNQD